MLPYKELQFLIYNTPQENIKVDVVVKDETIFTMTEFATSIIRKIIVPTGKLSTALWGIKI